MPAKAALYTNHRPTVARLVSSNGGVGRRVRRRTRDVADTSRATATDPRASGLCPPHKGSRRTTGKSVGTAHPTKIAAIPGQFALHFPTRWRHNEGSGIDEDVASLGLRRPHRVLKRGRPERIVGNSQKVHRHPTAPAALQCRGTKNQRSATDGLRRSTQDQGPAPACQRGKGAVQMARHLHLSLFRESPLLMSFRAQSRNLAAKGRHAISGARCLDCASLRSA